MSVSTKLLVDLTRRHDVAAMRQLARLVLEGFADKPSALHWSPRFLLQVAAKANDRKAGWLLCKYYLEGEAGFLRDIESARHWRERTERRLFSDTQLLYVDPVFEAEARELYASWRRWLEIHWPCGAIESIGHCEERTDAKNQSLEN